MKFATLYKIHELLEADCLEKQAAKKEADAHVQTFEESHDIPWQWREQIKKVPANIREEYKELLDRQQNAKDALDENADAYTDFFQHDWH